MTRESKLVTVKVLVQVSVPAYKRRKEQKYLKPNFKSQPSAPAHEGRRGKNIWNTKNLFKNNCSNNSFLNQISSLSPLLERMEEEGGEPVGAHVVAPHHLEMVCKTIKCSFSRFVITIKCTLSRFVNQLGSAFGQTFLHLVYTCSHVDVSHLKSV